ncbi:lipocalin-like domain-containing protein [Sphingomonas sp. BIUV-7]|uniref:Lipocalin-like domain-containing protein n=1 Tax=Sphingomonas natans TaxID=3063330 RepID=A0ABT8Y8J9_9SPHN|nr:lipocalin-like domain-containing protein [Sphingomonas sp. BIUV-7]MDO6414639.1 lipocalin-like domain-containing protein [Sphingomonas sp. BIUV-7]
MGKKMFVRALLLASVSISPLVFAPLRAAAQTSHTASAGQVGLVGVWRLYRFEDTSKDGKVEKPYGDHPLGYFIYDRSGHLSVQIMRNPPLPKFTAVNGEPSDSEKVQAYRAYVSYFGTYREDTAKHVLHHQVEGALDTTYTNTDQIRPYRLLGDTLIIEDDRKDGSHFYRELHRVR